MRAQWTIFDEGDRKIPWNRMPIGERGEAFRRIVEKLKWDIIGYRQIALSAEITGQLYVVLKGIQEDEDFGNIWKQVEDMEFMDFVRRLYTYYASRLLG